MCRTTQRNTGGTPTPAKKKSTKKGRPKSDFEVKDHIITFEAGGKKFTFNMSHITNYVRLLYGNKTLSIEKISNKTKTKEELIIMIDETEFVIQFNSLKKYSLITIKEDGTIVLPN